MKPSRTVFPLLAFVGLLRISWWFIAGGRSGDSDGGATSAERERPKSNQLAVPEQPGSRTDDELSAGRSGRGDGGASPRKTFANLLPNGRTSGQISRPVIEAFLAGANRSAKSLLTAFRESGDRSYLNEAAANFPGDPRVQVAMITDPERRAERDQWIAALQKSDPDNALGDYFAALAAYQRGDEEGATQQLANAAGKTAFAEYLWDVADELERLYLSGGLPPAEAKAMAMFSIPLPHLAEMRELGAQMQATQTALRNTGDIQRANDLLAIHLQLGRTLSAEAAPTLIHRLVGMVIERQAIESAPADAISAVMDSTGSERLAELRAMREDILASSKAVDITSADVSDHDIVRYFDLVRGEGELAALKWLAQLTGKP